MESIINNEYNRESNERKNTMEVSGTGIVRGVPDIAAVSIGIITSGKEVEPAQRENAIITQRVISQIKSLGIEERDIQTQAYSIDTIYDYQDGKQIFKEYRVTNTLRVTIRDIRMTGAVIDKAVSSGANFVGNVEFMLSEHSKYYRRALQKALEDAVLKAQALAMSLDVKLERVPLRLIEETRSLIPYEVSPRLQATSLDTTPIQPGQLEIKANLKAIFTCDDY